MKSANRKATSIECYVARASKSRAAARGANPPFSIEVRFHGGLTPTQKDAFRKAADRWCRVIVGDLPRVRVDGEVIDDLLILAQGSKIDGVGNILGQAGPTRLRPKSAGASAYLPAKGEMQFDIADLKAMEADGTLNDVICHEMGHVLGIGTVWSHKSLLKGAHTPNPTFTGAAAMKEYAALRGGAKAAVPVEATGGEGTRDSHWRDSVFGNELMTGWVSKPPNPMSRMTVASLQDLGYVVNLALAEKYSLPNHLLMAERGAPAAPGRWVERGVMLPHIPLVLPEDCLV